MNVFRKKFLKLFAFLSLLGMFSLFADLHTEEYQASSSQSPSSQSQSSQDECCVACCPAHHLAPSPVPAAVAAVPFSIAYAVPVLTCLSVDPSDSLFRPPRSVLAS